MKKNILKMEDPNNNQTQTSLAPINTLSSCDTLEHLNTDREDMEEDESENIIIKRVITSRISTPAEELRLNQIKDLLSTIIRFDVSFTSEKYIYKWVVYHTAKEVRKHIKQIYTKIANREFNVSIPIHPAIIQLRTDTDAISSLTIITDFYNKCFAEPNIQNNPFLTNFFNIGGTSFLKSNAGN